MYKVVLSVAVAVCVVSLCSAKRYCTGDSDCTSLGDLTCQYSACPNKGVCGCPRNQVAKWMGSGLLFQCVPLRKVGQRCSNWLPTGTCGAPRSYCDDEIGYCVCQTGYIPDFAGEKCESMSDHFTDFEAGETCVTGGSVSCSSSTCSNSGGGNWYNPASSARQTCACNNDEKLELVYDESTPFPDRLIPECVSRIVGDACKQDSDCPGSSECTSNVCTCPTNTVRSFDGSSCTTTTGLLVFNANCSIGTTQNCDGSNGMICGDMCDWTTPNGQLKCKCGPGYRASGTSCTANQMGEACVGDMSCRATNKLAICEDNVCVDGSVDIPSKIKVYDEENAGTIQLASLPLMAVAAYLAL